jgi:hypothetical protein
LTRSVVGSVRLSATETANGVRDSEAFGDAEVVTTISTCTTAERPGDDHGTEDIGRWLRSMSIGLDADKRPR